jgi:hypothetical protein
MVPLRLTTGLDNKLGCSVNARKIGGMSLGGTGVVDGVTGLAAVAEKSSTDTEVSGGISRPYTTSPFSDAASGSASSKSDGNDNAMAHTLTHTHAHWLTESPITGCRLGGGFTDPFGAGRGAGIDMIGTCRDSQRGHKKKLKAALNLKKR